MAPAGATMGRMEFRVLGPLEVIGPRGAIAIGSARERAILAMLVLNAGTTVSTERLIDEIWGDDPPTSGPHAVAVNVARLRSALGAEWLETQPGGYRLRAVGADIDLQRFDALVSEGSRRFAIGDAEAAASSFGAAIALWRGPALGDLLGGDAGRAERTRLDERRLLAVQSRIDADLARGRHAEVVPDLRRIVAEMPLRETFQARLMLALYRSGRQAEALEVYHSARDALDHDLGVDPGEELEGLQRRILAHDPKLAVPPGSPESAVLAAPAEQPGHGSTQHAPRRIWNATHDYDARGGVGFSRWVGRRI